MNYFQLIIKQMRQRALSTWLTILSVVLGVSLAIAIMVLGRESQALFGQNDYGYDALIGVKGSKLQLVLNTVYHMDVSPGNIPWDEYTRLLKLPDGMPVPPDNYYKYVKNAVPFVVGDTLQGQYRIVGITNKYFGFDEKGQPLPPAEVMDYRPGLQLQFAQGRVFATNKFEAIVGSDIPKLTDVGMGSEFQATHGTWSPNSGQPQDLHVQKWKVVGVLAPTHTAIDRAVYIPLISFYTIAEHGNGLRAHKDLRQGQAPAAGIDPDKDAEGPHDPDAQGVRHFSNYDLLPDGTIKLNDQVSPDVWEISGIMVQSRGGVTEQQLEYDENNNGEGVMAVNPATVMREFFDTFLKPTRLLLLLICSLVTIVAAVGILVSIYNSVSSRLREIAILRALGATRQTVLSLICLEAGLIALIGSIVGLIVGHAVCAIGSWYMNQTFGESINWYSVSWFEFAYAAAVVVLALIAGLVPAIKAYRTSVAANLVAV